MTKPSGSSPRGRGRDDRPPARTGAAGGNSAKVVHGLRGPVDVIMSSAQALWRTGLGPEQHRLLGAIRRSTGDLLTVINDTLDIAAIESDRIDLIRSEFNLRDCLADTLSSLRPRAERKGFHPTCEIDPDVPNILFGDPGRLRQVVAGLVDNAIRFAERGRIGLNVRTESQSSTQAVLHFQVSDTGIGIVPETQGQVFSSCWPGGPPGGLGVGLAVAARLVEKMGGRIWADSEVGRGSRFHFTARFGLAHEPVPKFPSVPSEELPGLQAVIVNDNPAEQADLRRLLDSWGIGCLCTARGWQGLAEAKRGAAAGQGCAFAMLDANVPDVDAFVLAERFTRDPDLAPTAVLVLSSAGIRGDAARCQAAGVAAYLSKPVARADLRQAICACAALPAGPGPDRLITRHSLREDREFLLILLAAGGMIHRETARTALAGWGHKVVCVETGPEVLEVLGRQRFDLVLMDAELAGLDAFAVAAAVRRDEQATGAHLPLLGMTPHASDQDRQRCLDAGLDGCVSKPLHVEQLLETVHAVAGVTPPAGPPTAAEAEPPPPPEAGMLFDEARALEFAGGSREALDRELGAFLRNCPLLMADLRRAIEAGDASTAWRAAHILRTAVATFATAELVDAVQRLEESTDRGDLKRAGEDLPAVEERMARFEEALASAIKEHEVCRF